MLSGPGVNALILTLSAATDRGAAETSSGRDSDVPRSVDVSAGGEVTALHETWHVAVEVGACATVTDSLVRHELPVLAPKEHGVTGSAVERRAGEH